MVLEGLKDFAEEGSKIPWQTMDKAVLPPSYQAAKNIIGHSKKLFQTYEKICQEISSHAEPLDTDDQWNEDCWKLNNLFDTQKNVTKQHLNVLLRGKRAISRDDHSRGDDQLESNNIWTNFTFEHSEGNEHAKRAKKEHWAVAAERVGNGVRRLVKHLEEE